MDSDTAWRAKVAEQSSHLIQTAHRYYANVDAVKSAMEILVTLEPLRDIQDTSEKESDVDNPQAQEDQESQHPLYMERPENDRESYQSENGT